MYSGWHKMARWVAMIIARDFDLPRSDVEELEQWAIERLLLCARQYSKPTMAAFSTYAYWGVLRYCVRKTYGRIFLAPENDPVIKVIIDYKKAEYKLLAAKDNPVTFEQVISEIGLERKYAEKDGRLIPHEDCLVHRLTHFLNRKVYNASELNTLIDEDVLETGRPHKINGEFANNSEVGHLFANLSQLERDAVIAKYTRTIYHVAKEKDISRKCLTRIANKAIAQLQKEVING